MNERRYGSPLAAAVNEKSQSARQFVPTGAYGNIRRMSDVLSQFIEVLSAARKLLVTTHVRPDGDALGTVAALILAMRQKNIDSTVVLLSKLPSKYAFLFQENNITHHDFANGWDAAVKLDDFDAVLVADTGTWSQLP